MRYRIVYRPAAVRDLKKLRKDNAKLFSQIATRIHDLETDPRGHPQSSKLRGAKRKYRNRVRDWRIIFEVLDEQREIDTMVVAPRDSVY